MTKNINAKEIQKQMEYYLGDKNLARDEFFRDKISASKVGFVDLSLFQNCNKIKAMGITNKDIADSLKESKALEVSKDGKMVRRAEGLELPAKLA
jgi:lupus La protein